LAAKGGDGGRIRVGAEAGLEDAGVVGGLARVRITPDGGNETRGETPRKSGAEGGRLGINGRGAVEEFRE
jgi:hypothetical protein